uniref:Uncharacterized protein n=1 Tax=viral metagenome TaxID=1070528 RepID=A0A2V0RCB2_9ZZZZ
MMFSLFINNKKRLGYNYTKYFCRFQATLVSYAAEVTQVYKLGIFGRCFVEDHYILKVYSGILNGVIQRVKNSGQDVAIEYVAPFFCLPFFFFNGHFRKNFTQKLLSGSNNKFSL